MVGRVSYFCAGRGLVSDQCQRYRKTVGSVDKAVSPHLSPPRSQHMTTENIQ